jgi:hypothetical protein
MSLQMAALSVAPEPEPEPVHSTGGGGIRAVVVYDYEVRHSNLICDSLRLLILPIQHRLWKIMNCLY